MKNTFLVRDKKGNPITLSLPVKSGRKSKLYGEPTCTAWKTLRDYPGYVNLNTVMDDPRYEWGEKVLKDFAL